MDFKSRFNNRRHCDVKVVVDGSTFYLHRFPLEAASTFFDERFGSDSDSDGDNQPARPARPTVELQEFPGGAPSFESVARYVHIVCWRCCRVVTTTNGLTAPTVRYCYGFDLELDLENIAPMFAAARYLGMATLQGALGCACTPVGGAQRPRLPCLQTSRRSFSSTRCCSRRELLRRY